MIGLLCVCVELSVDCVFQALASLELRLFRGGNLEWLAGAGIAALRGRTLAHIEGAEADKTNLMPLLQRLRDGIEHSIHSPGSVGLGELGDSGNCIDEFIFVHELAPLLFSARSVAWSMCRIASERKRWSTRKFRSAISRASIALRRKSPAFRTLLCARHKEKGHCASHGLF